MKILIFLGVLISLMVIGRKLDVKYYSLAGALVCIISLAILCISLITLPLVRLNERANIETYHSFIETLNNTNINRLEDVEKALMRDKILEINSWLARSKYYNDTILDWFIPDEILKLEPIKMN